MPLVHQRPSNRASLLSPSIYDYFAGFFDLNREGVYYYQRNTPETAVQAMRAVLASGKNPDYAA